MKKILGVGLALASMLASIQAADQLTLLPGGADGKFHVPTDGSLGTSWKEPSFNDAGWSNVIPGVGFDAPNAPVLARGVVADSVAEFSGVQGGSNWYYGYWDMGVDTDGAYQAWEFNAFPREPGNDLLGPNNYWDGAKWDWFNGNPPWSELSATGGHPNHPNGGSGAHHYVIRRWVSEMNGLAHLVGNISHGGGCGDGVDLRVWVDGVEVLGLPSVFGTNLAFAANVEVQIGSTVDFGIGPNVANDFCDGFGFNVKVLQNTLADSVEDFTGVQGMRGWTYGYYNKTADGDAIYDPTNDFNNTDPNLTFGGTWSLGPSDPPWTSVGQTDMHPNSGPEHWAIRRYTSSYAGPVRIAGLLSIFQGCGGGTRARIFVDGIQVFSRDVSGISAAYSVIANVSVGSRIDFALDPNGDDGCDTTTWTAVIQPAAVSTMLVANSETEFSGIQGQDNWNYGYYNRTADGDATYSPASDFNTTDPNWTYGGAWTLGPGDPPWDTLGQVDIHPNGINNGAEHWIIRRWVSEVTGAITVDWHFAKTNPGGDGASLLVFQNGVQVDAAVIGGGDRVGLLRTLALNVKQGDWIDFAHTPVGPTSDPGDGADGSKFTARIYAHSYNPGAICVPVADSQIDWSATGQQGFLGWSYGHYNKTTDAVPGYQAGDYSQYPHDGNGWSPTDYWSGGDWNWNPDFLPWDLIGQTNAWPSGVNSGDEHWVIRRWTSTASGTLRVDWFTKKLNPFGSGVTGKLFHNGVEMDSATIAGNDIAGVQRIVSLLSVNLGDTIDLALTPIGPGGATDDGGDISVNGMTIYACTNVLDSIASNVAAQMKGVNSSAYLRQPFNVGDPLCLDQVRLRMKFDDGFVAYLNGVEVARRHAPSLQAGAHVANSVSDWSGAGIQGANNWFYGFYNQTTDPGGVYQDTDFDSSMVFNGWLSSGWSVNPGPPPWTSIGQTDWHPNGDNNGFVQWPVRRWVSEVTGTVVVNLRFAKANPGGGNGVTGRLHHNGTLVYSNTIAFNDTAGVNVHVPVTVVLGDKLDFSIDALGTDGGFSDGSDGSTCYMDVRQDASPALTWNSRATASRTTAQALATEVIDITAFKSALVAGVNILAIHGLNRCVDDSDFLLAPEITATVLPAEILVQPQSRTNLLDETAEFQVIVRTCAAASYQWRSNGTPILNETADTLFIDAQLAHQAGYDVIITNPGGSTTSVVAILTVNRHPVALDNGAFAYMNTSVLLPVRKLLNNDSDPDGDPVTVLSVTSPAAPGGAALLSGPNILYTPAASFTGNDTFTYTISDGRGGSATATVEIFVYSGALPSENQVLLQPVPGGYRIRFAGIPGKQYLVQRTPSITPPILWTTIQTLTAPAHGIMDYQDATALPAAYYRTTAAP